jgi:hypothetical protein
MGDEVVGKAPDLTPAPRSAAAIQFGAAGFAVQTFDEAWRFAQLLASSDLVPKDYKDKPANCLVAMQMGAEVGLKPVQAIQGIAVINGRPSIWGDALWALVQSSPLVEDAFEEFDATAMVATCTIKRKGRTKPTVQKFSKTDATVAGLLDKDIWKKNPNRMLQMRARAFAARDALPDVLKGISIAEESLDIERVREMGAAEVVPGSTRMNGEPGPYPAEAFAADLKTWGPLIEKRRRTVDEIIAIASSQGTLSDEQKAQIRALERGAQ